MFQQVTVMGRLSGDMEVKSTQNGKVVGNFSIPCTEKWQGGEHTEWFNCKLWGDRAQKIQQYMTKGKNVLVTGTLKSREHDGKKYTDLNVQNVTFGGDSQGSGGKKASKAQADTNLEDIPF